MPTEFDPSTSAAAPGAAYTCRDYRPTDALALHAVLQAAIRDTACSAYTPAQIDAWLAAAGDAAQLAERLQALWVRVACDAQGNAIGFAAIAVPGHIELLFTLPAQGRQGVASLLLDDLYFLASAMGGQRITVDASLIAHPFFLKHGFSEVRREEVALGGERLPRFGMEKPLAMTF